ncbi:unnamed protein product [Cuscuta epithymum]|uniref:Uncharacterized protein n=1 Tax=Cuscuta epithymum TaxID=186058 RepID=A0AAV0ET39_9ASTE|nr:unnamed protein product [Cuscuta epithymum]
MGKGQGADACKNGDETRGGSRGGEHRDMLSEADTSMTRVRRFVAWQSPLSTDLIDFSVFLYFITHHFQYG